MPAKPTVIGTQDPANPTSMAALLAAMQAASHGDYSVHLTREDSTLPPGVAEAFNDLMFQVKEREGAMARQMVDRFKDQFLSIISHEMRTPLSLIMGFASILEDGIAGELNEQQQVFLSKILDGADRMLLLVDDLLDVAKVQAGKLYLNRSWVDYVPLLHAVVEAYRPQAETKQQTLVLDLQAPVRLELDEQRVAQVMRKLLDNAVKFTPEGGEIRVRSFVTEGGVVTSVQDNGIGITPSDLLKLFDRFRQLDMSSTREVGGTGLGLSLAKALVEAHGGSITAMSPGLGKGSTFEFVLPLPPSH